MLRTKTNNRKRAWAMLFTFLLLCSLALEPLGSRVEAAPNTDFTLGGKLINGAQEPLKITANDAGEIISHLWQRNTWNQTEEYVRQYLSWGTNVFVTDGSNITRYISQGIGYTPVPTMNTLPLGQDTFSQPDQDTLVGTWLLDNGNIEFKQTIYYPPNQRYYEKSWSFLNKSATKTYTNLKLIHGGDTIFGGEDLARSYWDPTLNMIYVKNSDMNKFGIMGFAGKSNSPADRYFGGMYHIGMNQASNGELSNEADPSYVDAGFQLQWNHASLAPGEQWVVESTEMLTAAGTLQVISPASQTASANSTVSYIFKVQNFQEDTDIFQLNATSAKGWKAEIEEGSSIEVPGKGSVKSVSVNVFVPKDAEGSDTLTLQAVSQKNSSIANSSNVSTTIKITEQINADLKELSITSGALDPVFQSDVTDYQVTVPHEVEQVSVTAAVYEERSTLKIQDRTVLSGQASHPISIHVGDNTVPVEVTGHDGTTKKLYTIHVVREPSRDARLLNIAISPGMMKPAFSSETTDYQVELEHQYDQLSVTDLVYSPNAVMSVTGATYDALTGIYATPIQVGNHTVEIKITAQDGLNHTIYKLKIHRKPLPESIVDNRPSSHSSSVIIPIPDKKPPKPEVVHHQPYMKGYADGTFRPYNSMTRSELAAILWRLSTNGDSGAATPGNSSFQDVTASHWAYEAIAYVKEQGVMKGVGSVAFDPNRPLTRAEFAATIARWKQLTAVKSVPYSDVEGHWAAKDIAALAEAGVTQGYEGGSFHPNAPITRAEIVTMLNRLLKRGPLQDVAQPTWIDVQTRHWAYGDIEEASREHQAELMQDHGEKYIPQP